MLRILGLFACLLAGLVAKAQPANEREGEVEWNRLKHQPITEQTFRAACDLMQRTGRTNINRSYEMLAQYVPMVKKTGNRAWVHILLMGWARAKSSMIFSKEADELYRQARENAGPHTRFMREALVATAVMFGEWGKEAEFKRYLDLGEQECRRANDKENLSFIYTFRANTYQGDTAAMRDHFEKAIRLATGIRDKNALFTAKYNYAVRYYPYNPQKQVAEFEALLELAKDSSLNRYPRKLYERTAFTFRNAGPSVYYQLMQINLLLADYDNAWKFAELFYDATVKPNPLSIQAGYFNAEVAVVKIYQRDFAAARKYLVKSKAIFGVPEAEIPYSGYFLAAGLLAEHTGQYARALQYYEMVREKEGEGEGLSVIPFSISYAHVLTLNKRFAQADQVFSQYRPRLKNREYTASGLYFYQYYADLLKARGDYPAYAQAQETFYAIKDSLTNLNQYRSVQEILAKVRIRDKEQQIIRLNEASVARDRQIRQERIFYTVLIGLSILTIVFLVLYLRNRQIRSRQKEALQQSQLEQLEKERHIELMRGIMDAEETERRKIADQLHDEVNAMLALATLNVSSTLEKGVPDERSEKKLHKTQEVLLSVSTTIRELSHRLTPLAIEKYGFAQAMTDLGETVNTSEKLKLDMIVVGFNNPTAYPISLLNDLYRIVQELVHNILKHAQATHATIEVVGHKKTVSIIAEDDGVGFVDDGATKGKGLTDIKTRTAYLNGQMEIKQKQDSGTLIVIDIPFNQLATATH
ncbi:ATP-binding protein [Spirosoma panaciterrae]|uniref:ATP-binding protein n=1 Tax=Spirosoma panaciterrae TaxID=496058 RepID=UPI0003692627|nr:ATP-binding protein [Spirosoma panaciterrae]